MSNFLTSLEGTPEPENVLSSPMAAGLLLTLKAECEAQHARAEKAEAELAAVRASVGPQEGWRVGRRKTQQPPCACGHYTREHEHVWDPEALKHFWFCHGCERAGVKYPKTHHKPKAAAGPASLPEPETTQIDEEGRCAVCGWTLAIDHEHGCVRGSCSQRPFPDRFYAPQRAAREYGQDLTRFDQRAALTEPAQTKDETGAQP